MVGVKRLINLKVLGLHRLPLVGGELIPDEADSVEEELETQPGTT